MQPGFAGFPRWTYTVLGTLEPATFRELSTNSILQEHVQFTLLPNTDQLVARPLSNQTLVAMSIQPTGYPWLITDVIKLGPVYATRFAEAGAWTSYSSLPVGQYTVIYQQTRLNHYAS